GPAKRKWLLRCCPVRPSGQLFRNVGSYLLDQGGQLLPVDVGLHHGGCAMVGEDAKSDSHQAYMCNVPGTFSSAGDVGDDFTRLPQAKPVLSRRRLILRGLQRPAWFPPVANR